MAELTVYGKGQNPVFVAASSGGDTFKNSSPTKLVIKNDDATAKTLTVTAQSRCIHRFLDDQTETIPASSLAEVSVFEASRFNSATQQVSISFSAVTGLEVYAQRILT